jgi:hypothetical protein
LNLEKANLTTQQINKLTTQQISNSTESKKVSIKGLIKDKRLILQTP